VARLLEMARQEEVSQRELRVANVREKLLVVWTLANPFTAFTSLWLDLAGTKWYCCRTSLRANFLSPATKRIVWITYWLWSSNGRELNTSSRSGVRILASKSPSFPGAEQEAARQEREAGEAAVLAKLDVEQQAEEAMAKALSHPEVYTTVSDNHTHRANEKKSRIAKSRWLAIWPSSAPKRNAHQARHWTLP